MKFTNETLSILKHFASLNPSILIKQGNVLKTITPNKVVLAKAVIKQEMPEEFGIYDLNSFLSLMTLDKDNTEVEFDEHHVIISGLNGRSKIYYRKTDESSIVSPPNKEVNFGEKAVSFQLKLDDFQWVTKTSNLLQSANIGFEGKNGDLNVIAFDLKNDAAHRNSLKIGETDKDFLFVFKTENLKLIPDTYNIDMSERGISYFKNEEGNIEYWIATEREGNRV